MLWGSRGRFGSKNNTALLHTPFPYTEVSGGEGFRTRGKEIRNG
jgi:hypothetical protein